MRTKKKLFAGALAICLLSTISFSTLAWFNASESVTNKFMVASTGSGTGTGGGSTAEKIFSVDLWEYVGDKETLAGEDKDSNNNPIVEATEKDHDGLAFESILPGVVYHKEPVVENTGSYDQYVRVVVTLTNAAKWVEILSSRGITDINDIFLGHQSSLWQRGSDSEDPADPGVLDDDKLSYVYYLKEKLTPGKTAVLFEQVKLPELLTQEDLAKLVNTSGEVKFDIDVRADAIQTEGISGATDAASAFSGANWPAIPSTNP